MPHNPNHQDQDCVPCKEELCSRLLIATVRAGHRMVALEGWRVSDLREWNAALDEANARLKGLLETGPLASHGRDSSEAGGEGTPPASPANR
jgi:hypothetical protein